MKKILFVLAALVTVSVSLNAQSFDKSKISVGGTLGFTSTSEKTPDGTSTSGSSFKLIADLGYDFNAKNSFGVQVGVLSGLASFGSFDNVSYVEAVKALVGTAADMSLDDTFGFTFSPYIRHTLISNKTFDIFVEGVLGFSNMKTTVSADDGTGTVVEQGTKAILFELVARPGIAFKISKDLKLVSRFGAAGFQSISTKAFQGNVTADGPKITRFGLDAGSANLTFGVEYHF